MEIVQRATNPWGQDVLLGIDWSLFWIALIAGGVFLILHLALRRRWIGEEKKAAANAPDDPGLPQKIQRHSLASRLFHAVMGISMILLLITGFLPKVGLQFAWLEIHWITGLILTASIVFHIIHATFFQSLKNVWVGVKDLGDMIREMRKAVTGGEPPDKPGKYPAAQKMFHHAATLAGMAAIITGILMMWRIEQPLWAQDDYKFFGDAGWGWVYVLHGVGGVVLVTLTVAHVYFAILPEKRWMTWSMILGWIDRKDYLRHHDPAKWPVTGGK
ncbi:MAG: cytochrome b/b6 domain-containing protein [Acidobacteria bacterium]|nr:cytochrome b/b6 domain-containing protein [Acidobacteriota bacterium]